MSRDVGNQKHQTARVQPIAELLRRRNAIDGELAARPTAAMSSSALCGQFRHVARTIQNSRKSPMGCAGSISNGSHEMENNSKTGRQLWH